VRITAAALAHWKERMRFGPGPTLTWGKLLQRAAAQTERCCHSYSTATLYGLWVGSPEVPWGQKQKQHRSITLLLSQHPASCVMKSTKRSCDLSFPHGLKLCCCIPVASLCCRKKASPSGTGRGQTSSPEPDSVHAMPIKPVLGRREHRTRRELCFGVNIRPPPTPES